MKFTQEFLNDFTGIQKIAQYILRLHGGHNEQLNSQNNPCGSKDYSFEKFPTESPATTQHKEMGNFVFRQLRDPTKT